METGDVVVEPGNKDWRGSIALSAGGDTGWSGRAWKEYLWRGEVWEHKRRVINGDRATAGEQDAIVTA